MKLFMVLVAFWCWASEVSADISTAGKFFEEMVEDAKAAECATHSPVIDIEVFSCERQNSCNYVGKLKGAGGYQIVGVEEMSHLDKYCSLLKKVEIKEVKGELEDKTSDCKKLYDAGIKKDGVQEINLKNGAKVNVSCNMSIDGGGWTVFQRRMNNLTSFYRKWLEYENGFGDPVGNFWLGLKSLHQLTAQSDVELRIDMQHKDGDWGYAKYDSFKIDGADNDYTLHIGAFSGNIGDSLKNENGMKFSTLDKDNDKKADKNCATEYTSGWWFKGCFFSNLNGQHYNAYPAPNSRLKKMSWFNWDSTRMDLGTIMYSEMKLRAKKSTP